jgi:hypothetical protein
MRLESLHRQRDAEKALSAARGVREELLHPRSAKIVQDVSIVGRFPGSYLDNQSVKQ